MGWDDNGLPTERRVQNYYGVRCDPSLPHDSGVPPAEENRASTRSRSPGQFIELCNRLTAEDEKAFEHLWRYLGLSVDWSMTYATISPRTQRVSQVAFLHLLQRGLAYQVEAPTLWDVDFKTAVAQAELEDREIAGAYHRIRFAAALPLSAGPVRAGRRPRRVVESERAAELFPHACARRHQDDPRIRSCWVTTHHPGFGVRSADKATRLPTTRRERYRLICTYGASPT